jgi:hypothetical protein
MPETEKPNEEEVEKALSTLFSLFKGTKLGKFFNMKVLGSLILVLSTLGSHVDTAWEYGKEREWWGRKIGLTEELNGLMSVYYFPKKYTEDIVNLSDDDTITIRIYESGDIWVKRQVDEEDSKHIQVKWITKRPQKAVLEDLRAWKAKKEEMESNFAFIPNAHAEELMTPMFSKGCFENIIAEDEYFLYIKVECVASCEILKYDKHYGEVVDILPCE